MNYLAHLFLAQPCPDSYYGNLLGDFRKGVELNTLPQGVLNGLKTHYLVDDFTDKHALVKQGKNLFSAKRRRFAGVALDVLFDYFLIKHWHQFSDAEFIDFKLNSYQLLAKRRPVMPTTMQRVTGKIIQQDWFGSYADIAGVSHALDNIARRIRFKNEFNHSIDDINQHYVEFENLFLAFFPQLMSHIKQHNPEV